MRTRRGREQQVEGGGRQSEEGRREEKSRIRGCGGVGFEEEKDGRDWSCSVCVNVCIWVDKLVRVWFWRVCRRA